MEGEALIAGKREELARCSGQVGDRAEVSEDNENGRHCIDLPSAARR